MRILIVGNGGREHALLWKLSADDPRAVFFATRPNGDSRRSSDGAVHPAAVTDLENDGMLELVVQGSDGALAVARRDSGGWIVE